MRSDKNVIRIGKNGVQAILETLSEEGVIELQRKVVVAATNNFLFRNLENNSGIRDIITDVAGKIAYGRVKLTEPMKDAIRTDMINTFKESHGKWVLEKIDATVVDIKDLCNKQCDYMNVMCKDALRVMKKHIDEYMDKKVSEFKIKIDAAMGISEKDREALDYMHRIMEVSQMTPGPKIKIKNKST